MCQVERDRDRETVKNYVTCIYVQLLVHCHGCISVEGVHGEPRRRALRLPVDVIDDKDRVRHLQQLGDPGLRLREPQRGAGDPSDDPFVAWESVTEADGEGRRRGLRRRGAVSLPGGHNGILGLREHRGGQRPCLLGAPPLARQRRQLHGVRSRHRHLPGDVINRLNKFKKRRRRIMQLNS